MSSVAYVYPAGCGRGMSVDVKVGGQFLKDITGAYFSGQGIQAVVGEFDRPLTQREAQDLRQKLQDAREKLTAQGVKLGRPAEAMATLAKEAGITDVELKKLEEFRLDRADPKRQPNPQIAETVVLHIKVDPLAEPGIHELRLVGPRGLTPPLIFEVGNMPEVYKSQPADHSPQDLGDRLPVVVNGRLLPGEVDRYTLSLRKGDRVVLAASARKLIPYIADAVPGWFQAALALYDSAGKQVAFADHSESFQDPSFAFRAPASARYTLEIHDGIYRGREDFVYRIEIAERSPAPAGVSLNSDKSGPANSSNESFDSLPQVPLRGPSPQALKLPCTVNGRIGKSGEVDVFRFAGHKGEKLVAEVKARRLGSPLDSYLQLLDAKGRVIAWNDDFVDKFAGTLTHQADSYLNVALPESGLYFLSVRDTQNKGGADFTYRLRIGPPQPGFELRVVPSSVNARAGTSVTLTVYALRQDGFQGDIALNLVNALPGYVLGGHVIPGNSDRLPITLSVPDDPSGAPVSLKLEGVSVANGRSLKRAACPADDMTQAFAYRQLVVRQELAVDVFGRSNRGLGILPPEAPLRIPLGGSAILHLAVPRPMLIQRIHLMLSDGPDGITLGKVSTDREGFVIELRADPKKLAIGLRGNLILEATLTPLAARVPVAPTTPAVKTKPGAKAQSGPRPFSIGALPAIPFEVVGAA